MAAPFVAWSIVLLPLGAALGLALAPLRGLAARRVSTAAAAGLLLLAGLACLAAPHGREFSWGFTAPWLATTGSGLSLAVDGLNRYALLALAAVLLLAVCVEGRFGGTPSRARLARFPDHDLPSALSCTPVRDSLHPPPERLPPLIRRMPR